MPTPPTAPAPAPLHHLIGVDGGGTGTRARVCNLEGRVLGAGHAGPSGLSQGMAQAWRHVEMAIAAAFAAAGIAPPERSACALALALAGAERSTQRLAFIDANPGYALCLLENDALGALRGAFGGAPGRVVAAGTGSVGAVRHADGTTRLVGGWGFPVGDEGSGAWLGLRAMQHAQAALDGRTAPGALARAVWAATASTPPALLDWCMHAGQAAYGSLAPLVFEAAAADPIAEALLRQAAGELGALARALEKPPAGSAHADASTAEPLPLVVYGSIGERLRGRLDPELRARCVAPLGDAIDGALLRLRTTLATAKSP